MHFNKDILLQASKLSAALLLGLIFLPSLTFLFIFFFFSSFIIIPILCIFISAYILSLVLIRLPIRSFVEITLSFCIWVLDCSFSTDDEAYKIDQTIEDKAVSVVFDPSEIPCFEESDQEEDKGEYGREEEFSKYGKKAEENSNEFCKIQTLKVNKRFKDNPFYEVLSFWKRKEGEEVWKSLKC